MDEEAITDVGTEFEGGKNNPLNGIRKVLVEAQEHGLYLPGPLCSDPLVYLGRLDAIIAPRYARHDGAGVYRCRDGCGSCIAMPLPDGVPEDLNPVLVPIAQKAVDKLRTSWTEIMKEATEEANKAIATDAKVDEAIAPVWAYEEDGTIKLTFGVAEHLDGH